MKVNLLKAKLAEHEMTQDDLLRALHNQGVELSRMSLHRRLSNDVEFTRDEIEALINVFNLSPDETTAIFFTKTVS